MKPLYKKPESKIIKMDTEFCLLQDSFIGGTIGGSTGRFDVRRRYSQMEGEEEEGW